MKSVGAFEAKTHFSKLLEEVAKGEEITITRHGQPVAKLVPVHGIDAAARRAAIARLKTLSAGMRLDGVSLRALIEEGRR